MMDVERGPQEPRSETQEFSTLLNRFSAIVGAYANSRYLEMGNYRSGDIPLNDEAKIMATHTVALTLFLIERSSFKEISNLDKSRNLGINAIGFLVSRIVPRREDEESSLPMTTGPRTEEVEKAVFNSYVLAPANSFLEDLLTKNTLPLRSTRDLYALMSKCSTVIDAIDANKDNIGLNIDRDTLDKIYEHLFKVEHPLFEGLKTLG